MTLPEAVAYQRALARQTAARLSGLVRRGVAGASDGATVAVTSYDGAAMGSVARLAGPAIAPGDEVYLLNVTGDPVRPGWLVLGAAGPAPELPVADAAARASVSYGGSGTTLGSPVLTFGGLDSAGVYRVIAHVTVLASPASGQTLYLAAVIGGEAGSEGSLASPSAQGGLGAGHVRELSGVTSLGVAVRVRTDPATSVTWSDLRLAATCQRLR